MIQQRNQEISIGDIVRLKSGSPDLTVVNPDVIEVEWKNEKGEMQRKAFPRLCLEAAAMAAV